MQILSKPMNYEIFLEINKNFIFLISQKEEQGRLGGRE